MSRFTRTVKAVLAAFCAISVGVYSAQAQTSVNNPAASKAVHQAIMANLDSGGDLLVVANTEGAIESLVSNIVAIVSVIPGQADADSKAFAAGVSKVPAYLKRNGFFGIRGMGFSVVPRSDGLNDTKAFICRDPNVRYAPLWQALSAGQPRKLKGLDYLPSETVLVYMGDGDLKMLWKMIKSAPRDIGTAEAANSFDAAISSASASSGFDIEKAIGSLGSEGFFSLQLSTESKVDLPAPQEGTISIPLPSLLIGVAVTNDTLPNSLAKMLQQAQVPVMKTDFDGLVLNTLNVPVPLPVPFQPTFVRTANYFLLGSTPAVVKEALTAAKSGKGLATNAEFQKMFAGQPTANNGMAFVSPRLSRALVDLQKQMLKKSGADAEGMGAVLQAFWGMQQNSQQAVVTINGADGLAFRGVTSQSGRDTVVGILVAPVGLMSAIAIPSFVKARGTAQINGCINNMRQIDSAKEQWALANKKGDNAVVDVKGMLQYVKGAQMPVCPAGGQYTVGTMADEPSCSAHGAMSMAFQPMSMPPAMGPGKSPSGGMANAACMNNLRQIDAAKEQCAIANQLMDGAKITQGDISKYLKGGKLPKCSGGGTYILDVIGQNPTCTMHGGFK
ncbi:MAG: hypothetical protein C0404_00550 [Verrucomicrobia bacterium]|nr:hypothetical protein [Verrucomicrobiota bacterium]